MISGPHSRDYDFLFGHGALQVHLYAQSLPGMAPPVCETHDIHCERTDDTQNVFALLNLMLGAEGYKLPNRLLELTKTRSNTVSSGFIGQERDANGNMARFSQRYNFVQRGSFTIGSASQDYITNTHSEYFPGPQDKLFDLELGKPNMSMYQPTPAITFVPDYLDAPYGHILEPKTKKPSHLALHPGFVQSTNAVLFSTAINVEDTLDGFKLRTTRDGNDTDYWHSVSTSIILPLQAGSAIHVSTKDKKHSKIKFGSVPFVQALDIGDTIAVGIGRGAAAIKVGILDAASGHSASLVLKGDLAGMELGALRIVGYHSGSPYVPAQSDTHLRFAGLVKTSELAADASSALGQAGIVSLANEVALAPLTSSVCSDSSIWTLSSVIATVDGMTAMAIDRNVSTTHNHQQAHKSWNRLISRRINGSEITVPKFLTINGSPAPAIPTTF